MEQGGGQADVRGGHVRRDFDQALELQQGIFVQPAVVEQVRQVGARGRKARIDAQGFVVVARGQVRTALAFGQHAQRVVRLGDVWVQAAGAGEQLAGALEIAPLQLDQALVGQRVDELRVVFEGQAEARVGRFQVPGGQRGDPGLIQGQRLGR